MDFNIKNAYSLLDYHSFSSKNTGGKTDLANYIACVVLGITPPGLPVSDILYKGLEISHGFQSVGEGRRCICTAFRALHETLGSTLCLSTRIHIYYVIGCFWH